MRGKTNIESGLSKYITSLGEIILTPNVNLFSSNEEAITIDTNGITINANSSVTYSFYLSDETWKSMGRVLSGGLNTPINSGHIICGKVSGNGNYADKLLVNFPSVAKYQLTNPKVVNGVTYYYAGTCKVVNPSASLAYFNTLSLLFLKPLSW